VYKHKMPGNIYYGNSKIRDWIVAGLGYWASIQHSDGSFDEFYPNERGWVGPTAFTTFTSIESLNLLGKEFPSDIKKRVEEAIRRSANFIIKGESEEDHLANHHAMACLAVWKAYKLLGERKFLDGYKKLWKGFLTYHDYEEGWSREYDGIDPGYLSATVSFLGKIYQDNRDPEILKVCEQSIEACSYFVYPNNFYAGSMGSRNTLHFYPHGFEIFSKEIPKAAAVANRMLQGLTQDKLVSPEIMSDRYMFYRVPEFLQSYVDYGKSVSDLTPLPYQNEKLLKWFDNARIWIHSNKDKYIIANLAKGGVIKIFDKDSGTLIFNDCGYIGELFSGKIITTQWIDPDYSVKSFEKGFEVSGQFNIVPSNKFFNVPKFIVFRIVLLLIGWNSRWAHALKGWIRKILMTGNRPVGLRFKRRLILKDGSIKILDEIKKIGNIKIKNMAVGDEFFVRYVPQSRYFQSQELQVNGISMTEVELEKINNEGYLLLEQKISGTKK
ncbi:MAG: hypothetical protein P8M34_00185, partial [Saprospiraceae bacterium]|nr:hypothetical protein [Saprospiraceae bacterium]